MKYIYISTSFFTCHATFHCWSCLTPHQGLGMRVKLIFTVLLFCLKIKSIYIQWWILNEDVQWSVFVVHSKYQFYTVFNWEQVIISNIQHIPMIMGRQYRYIIYCGLNIIERQACRIDIQDVPAGDITIRIYS